MKFAVLTLAATLALAGPASSQPHQGQQGPPPGMMMKGGDMSMHGGPAGQDYMQAMQDMHQGMMQTQDRDPDRAFAKMMIQHHRGGIAMSEALLRRGKGAELKRMANRTIEMQRREIAQLEGWLERHGGRR